MSVPIEVGYYVCAAKSGRNAERPIVVLFDDLRWPYNVRRMRGIANGFVARRRATADEVAAHSGGSRMQSYRYRNCQELIEDECAVGTDAEFTVALESLLARRLPTGHRPN